MIKTVFFDIDDTIYDRSEPFIAAVRTYFKEVPGNAYEIYLACNRRGNEVFLPSQRGEISMDEMYIYRYCRGFADKGLELTAEEALEFQKHYRRAQGSITMTDTMREILSFSAAGFEKLGYITNGPSDKQRGKLDALGLEKYCTPGLVFISGEIGIDKPDTALFRLAQKRSGAEAQEILYVGDSLSNDIIPAVALGWKTIWYNRRGAPALDDAKPDHVCRTEEELLAAIKQLIL